MSSTHPTYQTLYQNTEHHELDSYYPPSANDNHHKPGPSLGNEPRNVDLPFNHDDIERQRGVGRTPSPSPSEIKAMKEGIDWEVMKDWRWWVRREMIVRYIVLAVVITVAVLISVYQDDIVRGLEPLGRWLKARVWGWIIPVLIMIVLSFPPLFGSEIIHLLCGLVWGPWIGFAIVVAGTFFGEVANFYTFKLWCTARADKYEQKNIEYGCLARVVREGGFWIALVIRYSAIPPHFATGIFAVVGMSIWTFCAAALLSMPRQFFGVYLGATLESNSQGKKSKKDQTISTAVLVVTIVITIIAMRYINKKTRQVKPDIIHKRRKARQAKLADAGLLHNDNMPSDTSYNVSFSNQQGATTLYAPKPKHAASDSDLESGISTLDNNRQQSMEVGWDTGRYNPSQVRKPSFPPPGLGVNRPEPSHSPVPQALPMDTLPSYQPGQNTLNPSTSNWSR